MYQIDNSTAAQAIPASTAAGSKGYFTDGNPATGTPATILPAEFMNMLMMENINVLVAAGIQPDKSKFNQLALAISTITGSNLVWANISGKPTTLVGYGITDSYTKAEINNTLIPYIKLGQTLKNGDNLKFGSGNSANIASLSGSTGAAEFNNESNSSASAVVLFNRVGVYGAYLGIDTDNQWKVGGASMGNGSYTLWHAGNFTPATKADKATTLAGYGVTDAYSKAEINSTLTPYIKLGQALKNGDNLKFGSGNSANIASLSGSTGAAEFNNESNSSASAVVLFNRVGVYGAYLGIDTDNQWKVGGASMGNGSYTLWHAGNFTPDSKVNSDRCPIAGFAGGDISAPYMKHTNGTSVALATADNAVPVGTIVYFAASAPPPGFLKANGAWASRTFYAKLFSVIGTFYGVGDGSTTFTIPDLRGEFIRGWDDGRGVDFNRVFGSVQLGAIEAHSHAMSAGNDWTYNNVATTNAKPFKDGVSSYPTGITGGSETRPRNLALLACIKY